LCESELQTDRMGDQAGVSSPRGESLKSPRDGALSPRRMTAMSPRQSEKWEKFQETGDDSVLERLEHALLNKPVEEFKQHFMKFDHDKSGNIDQQELGDVLRSMNMNPSEQELEQMISLASEGNELRTAITYEQFLKMIWKKVSAENTESDIVNAFKLFDHNDSGTIESQEMLFVLSNLGEKMTQEQAQEVVTEALAGNTEGAIDYRAFAKKMSQPPMS